MGQSNATIALSGRPVLPKWTEVDLKIGRAFVRAGGDLRSVRSSDRGPAVQAAINAYVREHQRLTGP